jgi:hypothetical protein
LQRVAEKFCLPQTADRTAEPLQSLKVDRMRRSSPEFGAGLTPSNAHSRL